ncbi:MAG: alpha/beta fold hydrolase [Chromatiales bacterium]
MLKLYYRELSPDSSGEPLLMLHGLLGSSANWQTVARAFTDRYPVILPDLRNHGRSPHADSCSYADMTQDVLHLMDELGLARVNLVGHSMGGKLAMWLALQHPERVEKLLVADIAPVHYHSQRFDHIFRAMSQIDMHGLESRQQADDQMAQSIPEAPVRAYLLQNLLRKDNNWHWRINLPALQAGMDQISGFPETEEFFSGKTLFLKGEHSDYIQPDYTDVMHRLFPQMSLAVIYGAGHWLYAEQPQQFIEQLQRLLDGQEHAN